MIFPLFALLNLVALIIYPPVKYLFNFDLYIGFNKRLIAVKVSDVLLFAFQAMV